MNRFNQIYYAAVVIVFVFTCNIAHGIHINYINPDNYHWESLADVQENYSPDSYHIEYLKGIDVLDLFRRRKRGFFWSNEDDRKETIAATTITDSTTVSTTGSTITTGMATTPKDVEDTDGDQPDVMNIVVIGGDVEKSLVVAAPYLPLVYKVTTHFVPSLSPYKVVTLSLNVAALTTEASQNYEKGGRNLKSTESADVTSGKTPPEESSEALQTEPDGCATFGDYVTGKLKDAFESHFGPAPKPFVDGETAESSPAQTDSTFDKLKSKIYTVHNSNINGYDAPDTENDEHKIKATVTKTYIEYCQPPNPDTIASKLIENGMTVGTQVSKIEKEMNSNESSSNESDDSDDDDDEFENIIELYDVEINEEDFNKVKQESMELQPDFVKTLSGEMLLKHIDELQNSLQNSNINSKNVFMALTERLDIDEDISDDQIDELIDGLVKTTNYFISSALEKKNIINYAANELII